MTIKVYNKENDSIAIRFDNNSFKTCYAIDMKDGVEYILELHDVNNTFVLTKGQYMELNAFLDQEENRLDYKKQ